MNSVYLGHSLMVNLADAVANNFLPYRIGGGKIGFQYTIFIPSYRPYFTEETNSLFNAYLKIKEIIAYIVVFMLLFN